MKLLKNKVVLLSPIIVLAVVLIFGLTMVPSIKPTPKNVPIAFVNEDEGVMLPNKVKLNMGKEMALKIKELSKPKAGEEPVVDWITVSSKEDAKKGLNNKKYYAALIIPSDFSQKQATLQSPNPISPQVQIWVNQGMNTMASNMSGQMLNGIVDQMNQNIRTQILSGFEKQGMALSVKQAGALAAPIAKKVTNVNEIGTHSVNGNAPISLFQPIWMASIAGSAVLFLIMNKFVFASRKVKLFNQLLQITVGAVLAFLSGFGLTWLANILGMDIPQFADTAWFLSITCFCFFLMISAVLSWLGLKGISIFVLILFFGVPLLTMAPEFMSSFYQVWIYTWLPMRFLVDGLRDLLFFGKDFSFSHSTSALVGIGSVSLVVLLASSLKPSKKNEKTLKKNPSHML